MGTIAQSWTASRRLFAALLATISLAPSPVAGQSSVAEPPATVTTPAPRENFAGTLEFDGSSKFSRVRVRRKGSIRSLLFVRDGGEEVLETQIDLRRPQALRFEYLRYFLASYLLQPQPRDVLVVGLGGGGIVHFFAATAPTLRIEAVEIDPLVVKLADKYFGVRSGGAVNVVVDDGLKYIAASKKMFDVVDMDAFLKPSEETDDTGAPLALRTRRFYRQIQRRLRPGGVVTFNLNPHPQIEADVREIAAAFGQTYVFQLPGNQGLVVAATADKRRVDAAELVRRGRQLDAEKRFAGLISLREIAQHLRR